MPPIINTQILKSYKTSPYDDDYFVETQDKRYGLYFYNIEEVRMMTNFTCFAIFGEGNFDKPLLNSDAVRVWYFKEETFTYAEQSDCLIFMFGRPYLLIKPQTQQFSFIEWDFTSIYYTLEEIGKDVLLIKEKYPEELDRHNVVRRTGETINLTGLIWYDFGQFDNALKLYRSR